MSFRFRKANFVVNSETRCTMYTTACRLPAGSGSFLPHTAPHGLEGHQRMPSSKSVALSYSSWLNGPQRHSLQSMSQSARLASEGMLLSICCHEKGVIANALRFNSQAFHRHSPCCLVI